MDPLGRKFKAEKKTSWVIALSLIISKDKPRRELSFSTDSEWKQVGPLFGNDTFSFNVRQGIRETFLAVS